MKNALTYRELLVKIAGLPADRLDDTATVYVSTVSEYFPVMDTVVANDNQNVLDEGHCVLVI